jgi:DNA-binding response OmpR family regulator
VETASSGLDALRVEQAFRPEAVILDLGLPDIDGKEVARRIRSMRGAKVTLIALTGWHADPELNADENCFDAYFVKPANLRQLLKVLKDTTVR